MDKCIIYANMKQKFNFRKFSFMGIYRKYIWGKQIYYKNFIMVFNEVLESHTSNYHSNACMSSVLHNVRQDAWSILNEIMPLPWRGTKKSLLLQDSGLQIALCVS